MADMNKLLVTRSFLASSSPTLADVVMYTALRNAVVTTVEYFRWCAYVHSQAKIGAPSLSGLPHFCRWFDQLQHTAAGVPGVSRTVQRGIQLCVFTCFCFCSGSRASTWNAAATPTHSCCCAAEGR